MADSGQTTGLKWSALISSQIPNLNTSKITSGIFSVSRGGTGNGATTRGDILYAAAAGLWNRLLIAGTAGKVLSSDGVDVSWQTPTASGANTSLSNLSSTSINQNLIPSSDNLRDLGATSTEWRNLYIDGIAHIDTLDIDGTSSFTGTASFNGSINLGNGSSDNITFNGDTVGEITPNTGNSNSIGASTRRYQSGFFNFTLNLFEGISAGAAPAGLSQQGRMFCRPNGANTQLRVKFNNSNSILIAEGLG